MELKNKTFNKSAGKIIFIFIALFFSLTTDVTAAVLEKDNNSNVRVGVFYDNGYYEIDKNGNYSGYGHDYLQEIGKYTGWKYEYVRDSFENCMDMLKKGEIDLIGGIQYSDDRAMDYVYANLSSGVSFATIRTLKSNTSIAYEDFEAFNGLKVGLTKGYAENKDFTEYCEKNNFEVRTFYFNTLEENIKALNDNVVDAIVDASMRKSEYERMLARFKAVPFYYITAKDNDRILEGLNIAISQIKIEKPFFEQDLYNKYYNEQDNSESIFTVEEKKYIESNPEIEVVYLEDNMPMEYKSSKGEFSGISADIMNLLQKKTGLKFRYISKNNIIGAIETVTSGEADFMCGFHINQYDYNSLDTSPQYISVPTVMVAKTGISLGERSKVGLVQESKNIASFVQDNYPGMEIKYYESLEGCLEALGHEEINIVLEDAYVLDCCLKEMKWENLQIINTTKNSTPVGIAFSKEANPLLVSIINKAILSIEPQEREAIIFHNTAGKPYQITVVDVARKYSLALGLVGVFIVIIIMMVDRKSREKMKQIIYMDPLTGNHNLLSFSVMATKILENSSNNKYAMIQFDINKFKVINDIYGYGEGDLVLKYIGEVIDKNLCENEIYAHVSSDNFVILLKYTIKDEIIKRMKKMNSQICNISSILKSKIELSLSFGIYCIIDKEMDIYRMIDRAGIAQRTVKGAHSSTYAIFVESMRDSILNEKKVENNMVEALQNKEFVVYYQPKYDILNRTIAGAEALVRWEKPKGHFIQPLDFIPIFEKNKFIVKVDLYVFEEVCKQIKKWIDEGKEPIAIAVNVSRLHLHNPNFVNEFMKIAEKYRVPPSLIELELTESAIFDNMDILTNVLKQMKECGLSVSMDDFGSGYSSLNMIRVLQVDVLKLDREFLVTSADSSRGEIVIRKIVEMAKELNISVVAEGVENEGQLEYLKTIGCEMAQGFLFARPMPIEELEKLLDVNRIEMVQKTVLI